ncbi:MAG: HlyD family type I secretion periplasmic adaptor subunit [Marinosulfonomonas sp.]|nr:HlyD family type I secretion periplasmic adaptor subunit [Marinosulfonomonas sp.]
MRGCASVATKIGIMSANVPVPNWSARRPILLGWIAIGVMLAGLTIWGLGVRITGAIVTTGIVRMETDRQIIQHPNGGVVGQISARDGDIVRKGDVLIRFEDRHLRSELSTVDRQLFEILVRKIRLEGERDAIADLDYSGTESSADLDPVWQKGQIRGQTALFEARKSSLATEQDLLGEQGAQIENQIRGMQAQTAALRVQGNLTKRELHAQQKLLDKGLVSAARVLALQRDHAGIEGEIGRLRAAIAQAAGRMSGLVIARVQLSGRRREAAITRLRDLRYSEIDLVGKRMRLNERLGRMVVRAPRDGTVFGSRFLSTQTVVRPAEPIMYLEPLEQTLQVIVQIEPGQVDQVYEGQVVTLRFSALDPLARPQVLGHITRLSPDTLVDKATGSPFYKAIIVPQTEELARIKEQRILPGMPVEAFLKTNDRTPVSYLTEPLRGYFRRAFRES